MRNARSGRTIVPVRGDSRVSDRANPYQTAMSTQDRLSIVSGMKVQRIKQIAVNRDRSRCQFRGAGKDGQGFFHPANVFQGDREIVVPSPAERGDNLHRATILLDRLIQPSIGTQRIGKMQAGLCRFRQTARRACPATRRLPDRAASAFQRI